MPTNLTPGAATSTKTSSTESPILVADDLRKSYEGRPALRGLTFALQAGGLLGFLGPKELARRRPSASSRRFSSPIRATSRWLASAPTILKEFAARSAFFQTA